MPGHGAEKESGQRFGVLRRIKRQVSQTKRDIRRPAAAAWRRAFAGTTFVGITGSHGKSTTAWLLGGMLATVGPTRLGMLHNLVDDAALTLLVTLPWHHRYLVQEVGVSGPGSIDGTLRLLRPDVGVVTAIGGDHRSAFGGSWEATAAEKAKLVYGLPADGLAVLNADDPLVKAMADGCRCRVVTYGRDPEADLRLLDASSRWPDRLSIDVAYGSQRFGVASQLVGTHWVSSLMAALLTALELGASPSACRAAIEAREPVFNRMSVHPAPRGAWYVLDGAKASYFGIEACLGFLEDASTTRKTVVFGLISDHPGASRSHYYKVARMALARADRVIFTGEQAPRVRRLAAGEFSGRLFVVEQPEDVVTMLDAEALPDEIIYFKGSSATGFARLFAQEGASFKRKFW